MCSANRGNFGRMARRREPVMDSRAYAPTLHRRLTLAMMTRYQEENSVSPRNRVVEAAVNRGPGAVEVHAMKIKDPIGLDGAAPQSFVPRTVECSFADRHRFGPPRCWALHDFAARAWLAVDRDQVRGGLGCVSFPRQGTNGCRHSSPEFCLFSAERPHGTRRPLAPRSALHHLQTCHRPWPPLQALRPRRYQIDSGP